MTDVALPAVLAQRDVILKASVDTGLAPSFLAAVVHQESRGKPEAVAPTSGATGLMQVIPSFHVDGIVKACNEMNLPMGPPPYSTTLLARLLKDPWVGMIVGARHLAWCVKSCGTSKGGLAKYHTDDCDPGDNRDSAGNSTSNYVTRVMSLASLYADFDHDPKETPVPKTSTSIKTPNMKPGLIPLPFITDRVIPDSQNIAWNELGQRYVNGVVLHRMQGGLDSTDGWFRMMWQPNGQKGGGQLGLTDLGIDNLSNRLYRWNDALGAPRPGVSANRSPWASGPVSQPYGDGLKFIQKYGVSAVNTFQESLEVAGFFRQPGEIDVESPLANIAMQAIAGVIATRAHDYGIPYTKFPYSERDGFSFVRWHHEITRGTGKLCPGAVIKDATALIIDTAIGIMRSYQNRDLKPGPDPTPTPPVVLYVTFDRPLTLGIRKGAIARERASRDAAMLKFYAEDGEVEFAGYYYGEEVSGDNRWLMVAGDGQGRIHASGIEGDIPKPPKGEDA